MPKKVALSSIQKRNKRRSPFTFLELFISLAIITLLGTLLGTQAKKSIDLQRFQHSAHRLACELRHVQILSLTYQADISLTLYWKERELFYSITSDEPIPMVAMTKPSPLGGIEKLTGQDGKKIKKEYTMTILSSGRIIPEAMIGLHRADRSLFLDLTAPLQIQWKKN